MKKILIVSEEEIFNDPRSNFLIYDLINRNHQIDILNYKSLKKNKIINKKCNLFFFEIKKSKNNFFNNLLWILTKIDFNVYKDLNKIKNNSYDIVICINTKIAKTIAKFFHKKRPHLILDLQDSLPDSYNSWYKYYKGIKSFLYKLILPFSDLKNYEKSILNEYNNILLTTYEAQDRIRKYYGKKYLGKILTLENYDIYNSKINLKKKSKKTNILYFGSFGPHRGLETIIKSANLLKKYNFIKFLIIGGSLNHHYTKELIQKKKNLKLKNLKILKWQKKNFLKKYLKKKSVGIIPHIKNPHTDSTIPFKLFQYMDLSMPQLVSNCRPLFRHIKKSKSGLIFKNSSEEDLKLKILQIINDDNFNKFIINGKNYISLHNWKRKCTKKFINLIERKI